MEIQLTNIKYNISKMQVASMYNTDTENIISLTGYVVTFILNKNIESIIEISSYEELTILQIKEEIEKQLGGY